MGEEESMTTQPYYEYFIRSQWPGRLETPVAIGAKFLNTLDALSRIDPVLSNWILADFPNPSSGDEITDEQNIKAIPLTSARSRIAEIVENYVRRDDTRKPDPNHGYHAFATTREIGGPRVANVIVNAGGKYGGGTDFGFGRRYIEPPDLTIVTYPLYKAVLLAINAVWRAPWACAQAFGSGTVKAEIVPGVRGRVVKHVTQLPLDPTFPYSIFHIPWIAYLSPEHAAGVALSRDILTERTPDGGLLMSTTTDRLDPDNPEHVRRARTIAETMIARFDPSSGASRSAKASQ
jgi:hypothetical protein